MSSEGAEASTSELGGGDGVVVADGVDAGALRAPGIHGQLREVPARVSRGSGWSGNHWRRGIAAAQRLTGGDVRCNSGAMVAETEGNELGEVPGPDVELLRG